MHGGNSLGYPVMMKLLDLLNVVLAGDVSWDEDGLAPSLLHNPF